jgi:hypothetical protein
LSEGYEPVGMGSREELTKTFLELNQQVKDATKKLWQRMAAWTRDQMIDAGAVTYFAICKDLAHIAGTYEMEDWMLIDERAERFRPLLNDEYSRDCLGELVGLLTHPSQRTNEYTMMQHSDGPTRMYTPIPYSILDGDDYTPTCGPIYPGDSCLPRKQDRYQTSRGVLTLEEFNAQVRDFKPAAHKYRFLDATWVKSNSHTALADDMYKADQARSRNLAGKGAGLKRSDLA